MKDITVQNAGAEMHALSSAAKPVCTWMARDAIQDCRESCGGHGYLKGNTVQYVYIMLPQFVQCYCTISVAGIGELRNNNDASCTYEGENNVLIQQTSNWLLSVRRQGYSTFKNVSPMGTASFFARNVENLSRKFTFTSSMEALQPDSKCI